jgi:hypothetical protein
MSQLSVLLQDSLFIKMHKNTLASHLYKHGYSSNNLFVILQLTIGNRTRIYMYICTASFVSLNNKQAGEKCQSNSTWHSIYVFCFYFSMTLLLIRLIFTKKARGKRCFRLQNHVTYGNC